MPTHQYAGCVSQRKVRARDVDRDAAIEIVEAAWADGQVTRDEYEQRVDRLLRASTLRDLEREILDLQPQGTVWRPQRRAAAARSAPQPAHPVAGPANLNPPQHIKPLFGGLMFVAVCAVALASFVGRGDGPSPTPETLAVTAAPFDANSFNLAREALEEHAGADTVYSATLTSGNFEVVRPIAAVGTDAVRSTWDGRWDADAPVRASGERLSLGLVSEDAVASVLADARQQAGATARPTLVFRIVRNGDQRVCITVTVDSKTPWIGSYDCRGQKVSR